MELPILLSHHFSLSFVYHIVQIPLRSNEASDAKMTIAPILEPDSNSFRGATKHIGDFLSLSNTWNMVLDKKLF